MIAKLLRRISAGLLSGVMIASAAVSPVSAAVVDKDNPNNYDNFAEALQLALCFYDANKCGDEVADDGYYTWRGNCHVKDGMIPLVPMQSLGGGKANEDSGKGDGGASAAEGLYVGTNMSQDFIDANKKYLDPDGDGCVDLTGGWHDAGDHVKFGLPGSYSASTVGWGYYEFRESYVETGLQKHVEDELRWINDYFMKATFLDDDGNVVAYCYQVGEGNNDHNYWCAPELQVDDTYVATSSCAVKRPAYFATTETPASDQTAGAAASLAVNYLNFKDTDPEYAQKCLDYALALYDFSVKTHHEVGDDTLTVDSLGYDGGFYTSSYDYDELSWAAVWLYYCTENYDYIDDIISVDESVTGEMGAHPYTGYMKRIIKTPATAGRTSGCTAGIPSGAAYSQSWLRSPTSPATGTFSAGIWNSGPVWVKPMLPKQILTYRSPSTSTSAWTTSCGIPRSPLPRSKICRKPTVHGSQNLRLASR